MRLWRPTLHARSRIRLLGSLRKVQRFYHLNMLLNIVCTDFLKACALALVHTLTAADSFESGVVVVFLTGLPVPLQRIVNAVLKSMPHIIPNQTASLLNMCESRGAVTACSTTLH